MKVLIIEDEIPSARRLERMLLNFEIEIMEVLSSVKQSVKWLENNAQPEIIFLDIRLADGLCFEIFKKVEITSKIIFTTAYSEYCIKAFDYNSLSYLLKPIKLEQLEIAIAKAKVFVKNEEDLEALRNLVLLDNLKKYKTSFAVKVGKKIRIIKIAEVVCFYSSNNSTYIKTKDFLGIINHSLNSLESELEPFLFFRVNRNFIVERNHLNNIISYTNSRLKISVNSFSETDIIVSRERVKEFKNWIQ